MKPMTTFSWRRKLAAAAGVLWLAPMPGGATEQMAWVKVDVSTPDQIIEALWTADSTRTPTTIAVAPGHYVFTRVFDTAVGPSLLPPIDSRVWIVGRDSATTTFAPGPPLGQPARVAAGRIFTVTERGYLVVRNLTVTGFGFGAGETSLGGGAAANFGGFLRFDNCHLTSNGTGGAGGSAAGGAILNVSGRLHVENTVLTGNSLDGNGGAIALLGGSAVIRRATIRENDARALFGGGGVGGGIFSRGVLTVIGSTIAANRAGDIGGLSHAGSGGGIHNDRQGTLWLRDSAVIGNSVEFIGWGGGIRNDGLMALKNTTVAANYAGTFGAGIFNEGRLGLEGATIVDNEVLGNVIGCDPALAACVGGGGIWNDDAGRVRAVRSIVAGNRNPFGPPDAVGPDCAGVLVSDGFNAVQDPSGCQLVRWSAKPHAANDFVGLDPQVGELHDSGKPGDAHYPLLGGSTLIDAGGKISAICTPFDQIGQRRVDADYDRKRECDVGAVEYQGQ
jgi:hypothetical protein